ncbi:50S ribosomal protein L19 [Candidatus Tremblaya phenacola PAVE]|nr:50S ribosomal protein L19 [Candidatus Tremblaya phenacola PAVE]
MMLTANNLGLVNKTAILERPHPKRMEFGVGDIILVETVYQAGKKRTQISEGIVISKKGENKISFTFTIRKVSLGFGIEMVFQFWSPLVISIQIKKKGPVRRAKLYCLRHKYPKANKLTV